MSALGIAAVVFSTLFINFCLCNESIQIKFDQKISSGKNGKILTVLINAEDVKGQVSYTDRFNKTQNVLFQINKILNVSGGFEREPTAENSNLPKVIEDANIGENATSVEDISEELNEQLVLKIRFLPQIWTSHVELLPKNKESNDKTVNRVPWELHLVIVPSVYCDRRFFGYFEKCDAKFFLKTYSLRTQFRIVEDNVKNSTIINTEWKPDLINWKWSSQIRHALKCSNGFLPFDTFSHSYITFANMKLATVVSDVGAESNAKFPEFESAYEDCDASNNSDWSTWGYNNMRTIFLIFSLFVVLCVMLLRNLKTKREQLLTSGKYNTAISPFNLDEFDDVDTAPFNSNGIAKKTDQGIL